MRINEMIHEQAWRLAAKWRAEFKWNQLYLALFDCRTFLFWVLSALRERFSARFQDPVVLGVWCRIACLFGSCQNCSSCIIAMAYRCLLSAR